MHNLLGIMVEQAANDVFTDDEIIAEVVMFYLVSLGMMMGMMMMIHNRIRVTTAHVTVKLHHWTGCDDDG